jgi:hypothetical protein
MNIVLRKIGTAFAALRRQGYYTREGDICCQSCALAATPDDQDDKYVFFHCQDEMALEETGVCCLSWDGDAALIIFELEAAGLHVKWNGNARTRIKVGDNPDVCCSVEPEADPATLARDPLNVVMMRAIRSQLLDAARDAKTRKQ